MRILSDLHLGHPGCRIARVAQLRPLFDGAQTVLFNGDTFELRKASLRRLAEDMRHELEALCAEAGARTCYLTGNHDPEITDLHHLDLVGGKVFLTHGDLLYDDVSPWSKFIDSIHEQREIVRGSYPAGYLDDLDLRLAAAKQIAANIKVRQVKGPPGAAGKLKSVLAETWPPTRPLKILRVWARSHHDAHRVRDQFRPEAEMIVLGHTHRAKVHARDGKHVINTGAFLPLSKSYLVDIDGRDVRVREVTTRNGQFAPGREIAALRV